MDAQKGINLNKVSQNIHRARGFFPNNVDMEICYGYIMLYGILDLYISVQQWHTYIRYCRKLGLRKLS